jgi:hypothetical protein
MRQTYRNRQRDGVKQHDARNMPPPVDEKQNNK